MKVLDATSTAGSLLVLYPVLNAHDELGQDI